MILANTFSKKGGFNSFVFIQAFLPELKPNRVDFRTANKYPYRILEKYHGSTKNTTISYGSIDNNKRTYVFTYMLGLNRLKTYLNDLLEVDVCINLGYFEWHTVHQMYEPIKQRMNVDKFNKN